MCCGLCLLKFEYKVQRKMPCVVVAGGPWIADSLRYSRSLDCPNMEHSGSDDQSLFSLGAMGMPHSFFDKNNDIAS